MTEREKMLAGMLYDCGDPELLEQCIKPKIWCGFITIFHLKDLEGKDKILGSLLGGKGKNLWITPPFYVDYGTIFILATTAK